MKSNRNIYLDLSVILLLILGALVRPWHYDEGWVAITTRNYIATGAISYVIYLNNAILTFVKPWFYILSFLYPTDKEDIFYFLFRVPAVVLCAFSWILIRKTISILDYKPALLYLSAAFLFLAFSWEFMITVRSDIVFSFGAFLFLFVLFSVEIDLKKINYLFLIPPSLPIIVTAHPLGTYFLPYSVIILLLFYKKIPTKKLLTLLSLFLLSAIATYKLLLWDLDLAAFLNANKILADSSHSMGFLDEYRRYKHLFQWAPEMTVHLACIILAYAVIATLTTTTRIKKILLFNTLAGVLFLAIFPSKWAYYVILLAPNLILLNCDILNYFYLKEKSSSD